MALTLRVAIELLSGHIVQLCRFISDHSLEVPPMGAEEHATLLKVLAYQRIPFTILSKELRPELSMNDSFSENHSQWANKSDAIANVTDTLPAANGSSVSAWSNSTSAQWSQTNPVTGANIIGDPTESRLGGWPNQEESTSSALPRNIWNWDPGEDANVGSQPFPRFEEGVGAEIPSLDISDLEQAHTSQEPQSCANTQYEEGHSGADNTEALVDQLSDRIGSLQIEPGGHIRYYGPTSNFKLVQMPIPNNTFTLHRTVRNDGQDYLNRLDLGKEVPPALEDHLVSLYFAWQDPALHVVNRDMFEASRASWREMNDVPYYSEALQNAMYVPNGTPLKSC
ncbi:hypothetical protein SLS60_005036 [Paraconiothyrium brasiliense]|uniref:Uncharacterized protein n=1 Tax=Paraconiothyrium brasiliense TaxID=300254 RepID=A0ABR3RH25_9PLEO